MTTNNKTHAQAERTTLKNKTTTHIDKNGYKTITEFNNENQKTKKTAYYLTSSVYSITTYFPDETNSVAYYHPSGSIGYITHYNSLGKPTRTQYSSQLTPEEIETTEQERQLALQLYDCTFENKNKKRVSTKHQKNQPKKQIKKGKTKTKKNIYPPITRITGMGWKIITEYNNLNEITEKIYFDPNEPFYIVRTYNPETENEPTLKQTSYYPNNSIRSITEYHLGEYNPFQTTYYNPNGTLDFIHYHEEEEIISDREFEATYDPDDINN
ncbi:hypothetical protein [Candidatus Phytoplasma pruni]|uniref:DUF2963 domain-containing protein n=1 Tax=Candidatus Phytoplasma pruni TaxID=479893 RepID=A0A851HHI9_9MOLU|nr:hypothetical protein [Candidatus Phytoplasma pruni]NWN45754.1 hypothetical protein [Candidatus Phytoplasma pruni]